MVRPRSTGCSHNKSSCTYTSKRAFVDKSNNQQRSILQLWSKQQETAQNETEGSSTESANKQRSICF